MKGGRALWLLNITDECVADENNLVLFTAFVLNRLRM